jgi:hypothetical protein
MVFRQPHARRRHRKPDYSSSRSPRNLSRLGNGDKNSTEGEGPRGPSERARASPLPPRQTVVGDFRRPTWLDRSGFREKAAILESPVMFAALCRDAATPAASFRRGELRETQTFPTRQGVVELRPPVNSRPRTPTPSPVSWNSCIPTSRRLKAEG